MVRLILVSASVFCTHVLVSLHFAGLWRMAVMTGTTHIIFLSMVKTGTGIGMEKK